MKNNQNTIVVASGNKAKIKEIADMLRGYVVKGYKDFGLDFEIEETGETFYENALIKAKTVSEALGVMALADDSGLCVDALDGAPGVYSARYSMTGDDEENNELILKNLNGKDNRNAKFVCCMVAYYPNGDILTATGETKGRILESRQGKNGFGYDPLFYSYEIEKCFGESTKEEKNSVSHRGKAVRSIIKKILDKGNCNDENL